MGRFVAGDSPAMDRLIEETIAGVGSDIEALAIPRLRGIVLGGGYGRGEGGVFVDEDGKESLYNDLDFYVVAEDGSTDADIAAIGEALAPVSKKWTAQLGVDVDFCTAKTPWRLKHDQERVMIQELIHGYVDVAGLKGEELFAGVERRGPEAFPWMEAARLMMNRGAGLIMAMEHDDEAFIVRNINKCVLGTGDARLIARGEYSWKILDRADTLGEVLYSTAVRWKFRPKTSAICTWETARRAWLDAEAEVMEAGEKDCGRSLYSAVRWVVRRRSIGNLESVGQDPVVRILKRMTNIIRARESFPSDLKKDWMIFN